MECMYSPTQTFDNFQYSQCGYHDGAYTFHGDVVPMMMMMFIGTETLVSLLVSNTRGVSHSRATHSHSLLVLIP
jgi:hypothetical protein